MGPVIIDTIVENNLIKIPRKYNNRRVKIIIIDPDEKENKKKIPTIPTRKLKFKIDETLEDVVPFSDIKDSQQLAKKLRADHWQ